MRRSVRLFAAAACCSAFGAAFGGEISYTIDDPDHGHRSGTITTTSDTQPITIDIGVVRQTTDVHIWGSGAGGATTSVGTITINGSQDPNDPYLLVRLFIASDTTDASTAFNDPSQALGSGLRNVGGLQFGDTGLRDHTELSITNIGDITGAVSAGLLFRIDAQRSADNTFGGTIAGTMTATRGDAQVDGHYDFFGNPFPAIRTIRAGWGISGNIVATGERDVNGDPLFRVTGTNYRDTWGSAERIEVNPPSTATAPGITGNINCEYGWIKEILCSAKIGTSSSVRSSIMSGVRLERLSIRQLVTENNNPPPPGDPGVISKNIYADIDTSARTVADPTAGSSTEVIETNGDYYGTVNVFDFQGADYVIGDCEHTTATVRTSCRKGIFVGGEFNGDINVQYRWLHGDMIARAFHGTITVGQTFKGAIVAVGSSTIPGVLDSVLVGFGDLTNSPFNNLPGFNGIGGGSDSSSLVIPPFEGSDTNLQEWYTQHAHDFNTIDSVIRATESIGSVQVSSMSDQLDFNKFARPRIESPVIGFLRIDSFDAGSVWSGKLASGSAGQELS